MNNNLFNEFDNYVKKFDLDNEKILDKYKHSYRVYEYAKDIANSLKLNKDDISLVMKCALLHDIGIFDKAEVEENTDESFNTLIENNFINKFVSDEEERDIILYTINNYNKEQKEKTNDERKIVFSKIINDANKIDLICTEYVVNEKEKINNKCIEDIKNKKEINVNSTINNLDKIIRSLSLIYNLNYTRSLEIILNNKTIENKVELLNTYSNYDFTKIEKEIKNYIKERVGC